MNASAEPDPKGEFQVRAAVQAPLQALIAAGRAAGHKSLRISSAFRSYAEQARVFRTTKEVGRAARPGHSEHQLGTAVDLRLSTMATAAWLAEHGPPLGFAVSYPERKQRLTGYRPEPWHVRFVGAPLATEVARQGWALEELFRARPAAGRVGRLRRLPGGDVAQAVRHDHPGGQLPGPDPQLVLRRRAGHRRLRPVAADLPPGWAATSAVADCVRRRQAPPRHAPGE